MTTPPLKLAVVGHTNTGKTSLMRTLMRDVEFGEVSDRPAVTRDVEAAVLRAGDEIAVHLFDTPGLEDSIGLLERLETLRGDRRLDGLEVIKRFLDDDESRHRFTQEAKVLRQLLDSDVALYVIDVRDRVLGKHRDELEILGMCARPVVPVLNFTAAEGARTAEWREHLSRLNMHAVAEFDTVVFDARHEQRLFEKMRTLLDAHRPLLDQLIEDRRRRREAIISGSVRLLADLLIDAAALTLHVPAHDRAKAEEAIESLKRQVRRREQRCVDELLALHRFRPGDAEEDALPIEEGAWGMDLFSPEALKEFGVRAGGAAAAGAMVGLTLDVLLAGLSLGVGTAAGAAIGGLFGTGLTHGRRFFDRLRGLTELRCDDLTIRLLLARQSALITALLRRGHAAMDRIRPAVSPDRAGLRAGRLPRPLLRARTHPHWSHPGDPAHRPGSPDPARDEAVAELVGLLDPLLRGDRSEADDP
jgi:GTPase SAR1 family protein